MAVFGITAQVESFCGDTLGSAIRRQKKINDDYPVNP